MYQDGFSYDIKKWIDGNIFRLVTANVFIYCFKVLEEICPKFIYMCVGLPYTFQILLSNMFLYLDPTSLYQAREIKFHQILFSTGLIHNKG